MPSNPGTWARRIAVGIDLSRPGVEEGHYVCAAYYNCTETGFAELIEAGLHVWAPQAFEYRKGIKSDRRAPAWEAGIIDHIECTPDGMSIQVFMKAMLNWPRLKHYKGDGKLPTCMKEDDEQWVYSEWMIVAGADTIEGFVGILMGPPTSPPDLSGECQNTIGCVGFVKVSKTGDDEVLTIESCVEYDASKHRRPADFSTDLENLDDPGLKPVVNPRGRYVQWLRGGRAEARDVPFALDVDGTSFDPEYGVILGKQLEDGRKYARHPDGRVYRLLNLSEMREVQPFKQGSRLAIELAKPNHTRRIMIMPDSLVLDMRTPVDTMPVGGEAIAAVTPENLYLASKLLPLESIFLIEDLMERWAGEEEAVGTAAEIANVGDRLEAYDYGGNWLAVCVKGECGEGTECEVLVHFRGWNSRWDEWVTAERVRSTGTATGTPAAGEPLDACLSHIAPCLTWCARWHVAVYKLAPNVGASLREVRTCMHDALASAVAPASGADGLTGKALARISWNGRLSPLELMTLLKVCPKMIDNIKLIGSMRIEIPFVEEDGETYNFKLLTSFIGGWLFSATGSDSLAAGKRRLHDPPGTHGYTALVPMTGRKPFERMRIDMDTGAYTMHTAAAHYTAAGSYVGGGVFPVPKSLGDPGEGNQWTYSLIDEKHMAIPKVQAGELGRAPQDTPLALQEKVAKMCKPTLSRFLFGGGRLWTDDRESRCARLE